jgi:cytochrome c556
MLMFHMNAPKLVAAALLGCALSAVAEQYPEMAAWMKAMDGASSALGKMDQKTGEEAVKNAERLAVAYEEMIAFWRQRSAPGAVKWSEQGKAASVELAAAAHAGDSQRASTAYAAVASTCQACHDAHREQLESGAYRVK